MVWTEFSTENADHVLQLGAHHQRNNHDQSMFDGVDAMVLENGGCSPAGSLLIKWNSQFFPLGIYSQNNKIPIYCLDVNGFFKRGILTALFSEIPSCKPLLQLEYSTEKITPLFEKFISNLFYIQQGIIVEYRNAINARKIEEGLVPILQERGINRPKIGMVYGLGHIGIKPDLMSKRRRDFTINNFKYLNFGKYSGVNKEQLNQIIEAKFDEEGYLEEKIITLGDNLFP